MIPLPLIANKLRSIFGPFQEQFQGPSKERYPMDEIPTPILNTSAQDRFNSMLNQFPERENVGNWRKLGAVIAGMGSDNPMQTADQFQNYHYYNKLKDYTTKLPFFQNAANQERGANAQIMQQMMADRKQDEQERYNRSRDENADQTNRRLIKKDEETAENNRRNADIKERTLTLRNWAARNKSYVFKTREDGRIVAINPMNPSEVIDTKVDSGELSDLDKAELQLEKALKLEDVRQGNRLEVEDVRSGNRQEDIKLRGDIQKDVTTHRSNINLSDYVKKQQIGGGNKPLLPTQQGKKEDINARQLKTIKPEWAPYIELDAQNRFVKINPNKIGSTFGFGGKQISPSELKEIGDIIFGRKPMPDNKEENKKLDPLGIRR